MKGLGKKLIRNLVLFVAVTLVVECFGISCNTAKAAIIIPQTKFMFDGEYYANSNPDIVAKLGDNYDTLLNHYLNSGKWEGRLPYPGATPYIHVEDVDDGIYKALFIGNSITVHPLCKYWWGSWGMAASSPEMDYVHKTVNGLNATHDLVYYDVVGFSTWERDNVRSRILPNLDATLTKDYDLVVIQVGENIKNTRTFEKDYETLVQYVKRSIPTAQVVLVGDFWKMSKRDAIKTQVAERLNCDYVDLSTIRSKSSYIAKLGNKVYGDDGSYHRINDAAVAMHPNDLTMEYIAMGILDCVNKENIQIVVDEY